MTSRDADFSISPICQSGAHSTQGFALVVVLMMLVVLTLLGVTGLQTASVEERLAAHGRDQTAALQAAEATLRIAELEAYQARDPAEQAARYLSTCASGRCTLGNAPNSSTYNWSTGTQHATVDLSQAGNMLDSNLAGNPKYIIECCVLAKPALVTTGRKASTPVYTFRIIVHAQGYNAQTQVTLESRFTADFQ
jgi:type IV pilus assembly protein PilX